MCTWCVCGRDVQEAGRVGLSAWSVRVQAKHLEPSAGKGTADPFVVVRAGGETARSKVKKVCRYVDKRPRPSFSLTFRVQPLPVTVNVQSSALHNIVCRFQGFDHGGFATGMCHELCEMHGMAWAHKGHPLLGSDPHRAVGLRPHLCQPAHRNCPNLAVIRV